MQKIFVRTIIFVMLIFSCLISPVYAQSSSEEGSFAPLSPEYLEWQKNHSGDNNGGYIPFPVDLSHLADNPPVEVDDSPFHNDKAGSIPSTFDLRNVNGKSYVTSVKNQSPYGTCWTFASIGALESNYLMQGGTTLDLSEMH